MGLILSWFRKPSTKELLREIQEDLDSIQDQQRDVELRTRRVGRYVVYSFVLYLLVGLCTYWYWLPRTYNDWLKFSLPFAAFPPLVMMVKRLLHWYYARQLRNSRGKVERLKKRKQDILDQVMETETYKVAKEILQQYAPEQLTPVMKMNMATPSTTLTPVSTVRRRESAMVRPITPASVVRPSFPHPQGPVMNRQGAPLPHMAQGRGIHATPILTQPGAQQTPLRAPLLTPAGRGGAPGVPMPRPVAPRERGVMDRVIDYLMKEGPTNSYALVCTQCESHNGMALKDDFPYMAYRCAYCHYWNPARKQRPPPPRLEPLQQPPPPPPVVSSSESSSTDEEVDDHAEQVEGEEKQSPALRSDSEPNSSVAPQHTSCSTDRGEEADLANSKDDPVSEVVEERQAKTTDDSPPKTEAN
ncbi:endoplasmic reticulum junction formation protein lunapark-A isoform X2 [Hyalella azteca]|uniref:Endoplasmic reticulum junction formation protein lunapark n=1 Tax=Hyalella azteca TaxID=294128 RepID=A0A8B7NNM1_HYAAZ|nr:endoplasmic reticulum junction formation protein lunapark-A isoform X2 [Hyalella azteca]